MSEPIMPAEAPSLDLGSEEQAQKFVKATKRGFSLEDRLKKRGLREATIMLFTDEQLGIQYGEAVDKVGARDAAQSRIDEIDEELAAMEDKPLLLSPEERQERAVERRTLLDIVEAHSDEVIAEATAQRDRIGEELKQSALVLKLRSVPPVIQKDVRRQARARLDITEKDVPKARAEEFMEVYNALLLSVIVQSVTDQASGAVNDGITYEEAIALADYLPPSQYLRLSNTVAEIQYRDGVSREIEGQEDFS